MWLFLIYPLWASKSESYEGTTLHNYQLESKGTCYCLECRVAQCWQRSAITKVSWVRNLDSALKLGWVCCWFSSFFGIFFIRFVGFPPSTKSTLNVHSMSLNEYFMTNSWELLRGFVGIFRCPFVPASVRPFLSSSVLLSIRPSVRSLVCSFVSPSVPTRDHSCSFVYSSERPFVGKNKNSSLIVGIA